MRKIFHVAITLMFAIPVLAQVPEAGEKTPTKPTNSQQPKSSTTVIIKSIEANMVYVPAGSFIMGCSNDKDSASYHWEKPPHKISLSSYYISKYDVTQWEWISVMGENPSYSKNCPECPMENISWHDAQMFINKLNQLTGKNYRLPTEAEWEYAARGGNRSHGYQYAGSNNIDSVAWYNKNSGGATHPVGKKKPNELGLYDMSGNVWQWCSDWFDETYYGRSPGDNPTGPRTGAFRVLRGGSWWEQGSQARTVGRDRYPADAKDNDVGLRLVKD